MYAVILSSLIYLGAFIYPDYLYVGVFLWMLPLLVTDPIGRNKDKDKEYGFKLGYVWGLIFFGGHLAWLACIVYVKGQGDGRMIVYFAAVAYFSLFSGFWLWFKKLLVYRWVSKIKNLNRKCVASCCTWVISTVTFICLTCYCSLAIFVCFDGYPFIHPLLPLVSWTWYIRPVAYFGTIVYVIVIVLVNLSIASLYRNVDRMTLIFLLVLLGFPALFQPPFTKIIINKCEMVYIQPLWNDRNFSPAQMFYEIARQLDCLAIDNPNVKFVLIPESGFAHDLMAWHDYLHAWTSLFDDVTIFIGGHRYEQEKVFNSLYHINNGRIVSYYDKNHLVPFVERIPGWISWIPMFNCVFTTHDHVFSYPTKDQSDLIVAGFQPFICSELFFEAKRPVQDKPILFICNDSWLALDYAKQLAKRSAKL
jgi:apolipoprotein N-acyltransferase